MAGRWRQFTYVTEREVRLISGDHHPVIQISTAMVNSWSKQALVVLKATLSGTQINLVATKLQSRILNLFQLSSIT